MKVLIITTGLNQFVHKNPDDSRTTQKTTLHDQKQTSDKKQTREKNMVLSSGFNTCESNEGTSGRSRGAAGGDQVQSTHRQKQHNNAPLRYITDNDRTQWKQINATQKKR